MGGKHWLQDVFGFYYVDNHPLVLCGWIVGPSARYMEQLSDGQVVQGCLELLQKFAGRGFNVTVPRPEVVVRYGMLAVSCISNTFFVQGFSLFCVWVALVLRLNLSTDWATYL